MKDIYDIREEKNLYFLLPEEFGVGHFFALKMLL